MTETNNYQNTTYALKEAHETIEWAMANLDCPDHFVETWGNMFMNTMAFLEAELQKRGIETSPEPHPDDLPF